MVTHAKSLNIFYPIGTKTLGRMSQVEQAQGPKIDTVSQEKSLFIVFCCTCAKSKIYTRYTSIQANRDSPKGTNILLIIL